jgi:ubiquinone/menaquinone biosynthesis C-methylase UbiE
MNSKNKILENIKIHNSIAKKYDKTHGEIFTNIEQTRIRNILKFSKNKIDTDSVVKLAFDMGCGSGNLSNHFLKLGFEVIGGDVSKNFLSLTTKKFPKNYSTIKLNGSDLKNIKSNSFDLVGTYSVLHHVPDYLSAVEEMYRVLKPGGILYIDHEVNKHFWNKSDIYKLFIKQNRINYFLKNWKSYISIRSFKSKFIQLKNPKYRDEGDIHVFKDDHIEWNKLENRIFSLGGKLVFSEDYLLFKYGYKLNLYNKFKNKCSDYRVMVFQK